MPRLLRNPFAEGTVNIKYPSRPEVKLVEWAHGFTTLRILYDRLAKAGYITKPKPKRDKRNWKHIQASTMRVISFLKNNPQPIGTQTEQANRIGIPYRTYKYILSKLRVKRVFTEGKLIGKGRYRQLLYRFKPVSVANTTNLSFGGHKEEGCISTNYFKTENVTPRPNPVSTDFREYLCKSIIDQYNTSKSPPGTRNNRLYVVSKAIAHLTHGNTMLEGALNILKDGINQSLNIDFGWKEIVGTIRSGLKLDRGFIFSRGFLENCEFEV